MTLEQWNSLKTGDVVIYNNEYIHEVGTVVPEKYINQVFIKNSKVPLSHKYFNNFHKISNEEIYRLVYL